MKHRSPWWLGISKSWQQCWGKNSYFQWGKRSKIGDLHFSQSPWSEAGDCWRNTVRDPFPPPTLRLCHAQTVGDSPSRLFGIGLRHFKSRRISQLLYWFKSNSVFFLFVDFACWWSWIWKGLQAAFKAGLFLTEWEITFRVSQGRHRYCKSWFCCIWQQQ